MRLKMLGIVALLGMGACASNNSAPVMASDAAPINKYCAISTTETIDPKVTTMYMGQKIGFCCEDCIASFNKDPKQYMKGLK